MSKTMTVSEFDNLYCHNPKTTSSAAFKDMVKDGPITIIPDPEPRPDFSSMSPNGLLSWIYQNGDYQATSSAMAYLRASADLIADRKGLT